MPASTSVFKPETYNFIRSKFTADDSFLDVGAGDGIYGGNLKGDFPKFDALEVFEPYIKEYHLEEKYRKVINKNILEFTPGWYDCIILGDVLEHIEESEAIKLISDLYVKCEEMIICIPFNSPQGEHLGNKYEIHLQPTLTNESFLEKYKGFRPFALRDDYGIYIKNNKANRDIPVTYDRYTGPKISHYDEELNPVIEKTIEKSKLTIVTGLWNITRAGRDFSDYITHFKKFLEIDENLFIYVPQDLEYLVWEKRKRHNTSVKIYELDKIKNDIYKPHWDKTQQIRTDPNWLEQAGWLPGSPQAVNEWYNPIVQSKMFFLHSASIWNPFESEYFVWLDAGITRTVYEKYLTDNKALSKLIPYLDSFLFLSYPYQADKEIHGFDYKAMNRFARNKRVEYVCRGGLFGGNKESINTANSTYYGLLQSTLNSGYMGTEESLFTLMAYNEPAKYRRFALDGNGLIVKFVEQLVNGKPELEPVPEKALRTHKPTVYNLDKIKTYVYILTFNFPQQLRTLLKSFKEHPEWLDRTQKVLIDNSTDPVAMEENQKIAEEYGFIHYKHFDNIGINGGRQYAAEHFDASDGDYYIFFEDDMCLHSKSETGYCRNGFRKFVPDLFDKIHKIMIREKYDFMKLTYTEVYMDNNIQVSWYNVPADIRTSHWPDYDQLPVNGLDPNCPRTQLKTIEVFEELSVLAGEIYYCNWPMIVNKQGNRKMFLTTKWDHPYEQTWMSHMYQETVKGNLNPAVLLAAPINHNRIVWYKPEERREN